MAAVHGLDMKKEQSATDEKPKSSSMLFGDPADYEKMSKEEQQEKTEGMMSRYSIFAGETFVHGDPRSKNK